MSTTKHTPGPWSISSACKNAINAERNNKLIGIGTTYHDPDSVYFIGQDEAIANARLIAAAPELLAACEEVIEGMIDGKNSTNKNVTMYAIQMVKSAIAKATQP